MKRALLFAIAALILCPCRPCQAQAQTVSVVAILRFQDDTGTSIPADLTRKLATDLHQKLATRYTDVLPRLLPDAAASTDPSTLPQIAALAKQAGARYLVRGGLLALTCEASASGSTVTAQLYADILLADDGTVVISVRAQGAGMDLAAQQPPAAVANVCDPSSAAAVHAFANAIEQLADSIHQTVLGANASAPAPIANGGAATTQTTIPSQPDPAQSASQDADLQQLIAQAEILVSSNANPNSRAVTAAGQTLQALKSALETKAVLMQQGKDTSQSDQDIATQRQALQTAVAALTADATNASLTGAAASTIPQTSEQQKGFLQTISDFASQSLSLLQNIQQMRTALQGLNESSLSPPGFQPGGSMSTASSPAEQSLGECIGVVTDQNGHPILNAQVAEQTSSSSTLTDNNGQYDLRGLLVNQMAALTVAVNGKTLTAQTAIMPGQVATVDFQFKPDSVGGGHRVILPPTVIVNSPIGSKVGALKGVVRDSRGLPLSRALVILQDHAMARTDSKGQYQFLNVPAGSHTVRINQNGFQLKTIDIKVTAGAATDTPVRFADLDRVSPAVRAPSFVAASGRTLTGLVMDSQNHPLAQAKISLMQQTSALTVFTGPGGMFALNNISPGHYRIVASKTGYDSSSQNVDLSSSAPLSFQFRLNQQSSLFVANLLKAHTAQPAVIHGRVLRAGGLGIADATVALRSLDRSDVLTSVNTNQSGDYQLNVPPGKYELRANASSYQPASRILEVQAGTKAQSDLALQPLVAEPSGPSLGRTVPALETGNNGGSLVGQVIDASTRRPIGGAIVLISKAQQTRTDENGRFTFENLPPGRYQLTVLKSSYSSVQGVVSIQAARTAYANLSLQRKSDRVF